MSTSAASDGDQRLQIALDRSWGAVRAQSERLDGFRGRATSLLGAASVIVGVGAAVGGADTADAGDGWTRFAISAFGVAVASAIFILWPRTWRFTSEPSAMEWFFYNATVEEMRSKLYSDASRDFHENGRKMRPIEWAMTLETAAVGLTAIGMLFSYSLR